jgi:hypothetical protein
MSTAEDAKSAETGTALWLYRPLSCPFSASSALLPQVQPPLAGGQASPARAGRRTAGKLRGEFCHPFQVDEHAAPRSPTLAALLAPIPLLTSAEDGIW